MRLISINTWGGRKFDELMVFLRAQRDHTDIFCFQEIFDAQPDIPWTNRYRANLLYEISQILPDFRPLYVPYLQNHNIKEKTDFPLSFGNAMFVRTGIEVVDHGEAKIFHAEKEEIIEHVFVRITKKLQFVRIFVDNIPCTIINLHGIWFDGPKTDNDDTREQLRRITEFLATVKTPLIMAGDFNLWPESESIKRLESLGLRNLITEYQVSSTRPTTFRFPGHPFADYIFTSPDITVTHFEALPDEVSDHLPLAMEFTL